MEDIHKDARQCVHEAVAVEGASVMTHLNIDDVRNMMMFQNLNLVYPL
jgi:hypothetical protein